MPQVRNRPRRGFTLVELLVVMVIIGILMSLILAAAADGVRRAEERATQALLIKLDTGLSDRVEALLTSRVNPNLAHRQMAQVFPPGGGTPVEGRQRAQVIATYDMMRAELPDVFYIPKSGDVNYNADYPLNFAAQPYPVSFTGTAQQTRAAFYVLPLGQPDNGATTFDPGTGVYGASYTVAAGLYKNLGYLPAGYDGADNNNNGLIDEYAEGVVTGPGGNAATVTARLAAHTHKTARSEMLYAILVEGQGPLGSVFSPDDFTDRDVRDTDGDGLPEFVDAWGEPLQFYRWPILYHSDLQKGLFTAGAGPGPYLGALETREQDPLDPNQQLVAPTWWSNTANIVSGGSAPLSGKAVSFQFHFNVLLIEPRCRGVVTESQTYWDRGKTHLQRRAYFSRFLIVSSGPDLESGIARFADGATLVVRGLFHESQAAQANLERSSDAYHVPVADATIESQLNEAGLDDITNHNLLGSGGGGIQL